ncbi:MAG: galactokinase [Firmicutes bacterium]|nr:galactokinase [Bacillota bacterium]
MFKSKGYDLFREIYGTEPRHCFAASGRVNIIGEHIDYNGGFVLPAALSLGCHIYCSKNSLGKLRVAYTTTPFRGEIDLDKLSKYKETKYLNYLAGVCSVFLESEFVLRGVDCVYEITVPFGSGLSSSAAIEVATGYMLSYFSGQKTGKSMIDGIQLAKLAQKAENDFVGVNCGIMDQFASANGTKGCAMMINCATVSCEYIPIKIKGHSLCIIDTNRPHNLKESKYNERRKECEQALAQLKAAAVEQRVGYDFAYLCDLSPGQFEQLSKDFARESVLYKRAKHCVYEQQRVKDAAAAMVAGDVHKLGALLGESHRSLRDLYEVSCQELDNIVDILQSFEPCVGVRMTGAGFGGCCVAFVKDGCKKELKAHLLKEYTKRTGLVATIYDTKIEDGARIVELPRPTKII